MRLTIANAIRIKNNALPIVRMSDFGNALNVGGRTSQKHIGMQILAHATSGVRKRFTP